MKILVTVPNLCIPGGIANYYIVLREHLDGDMEYLMVGARHLAEGLIQKPFGFLRDCWAVLRALRRGCYDAILVNPTFGHYAIIREAAFVLLAILYRHKVIVYIRGWRWYALQRRSIRWLLRNIYFHADAIIVQGSAFKRALKHLGCKQPIYVETTVVADEVMESDARHIDGAKSEGASGCGRILFLSRIEREKGVYEAIKAFTLLKKKHPSVVLTIAGDGRELQDVKIFAAKHNMSDVCFLGWLDSDAKYRVYAESDIFLFTSWGEGMPNVVVEAMAHGLPIVARAVGAIPDLFARWPIGFTTAGRDPTDYANLLDKVMEDTDLRCKLARQNREIALKYFVAARVASRLKAIHQSVLFGDECPHEWYSKAYS